MMKHTNKAISLLLTLCMALSLAPWAAMPARAEDEPADWSNAGSLPSEGSYRLQTDVDLVLSTWYVKNTVTLDLNGHMITSRTTSGAVEITKNGDLTLRDSAPDATHDTPVTYTDPLDQEKTVTVNGGVITDAKGRGVKVDGGGTFTMEGGTITGGYAHGSSSDDRRGGGVFSSGTFTMKGGTIAGNTADNDGGGVYVAGGTFTMEDGTITGNAANGYEYNSGGAGVCVGGGTFTMEGGTIAGNTAAKDGGGVLVTYATFELTSGTIKGNSCGDSGGGVYVYRKGTFTMEGGTVTGNTAGEWGGGVCTHDSESGFVMNSGTISGNRANYAGGGVYSGMSSNITMTGGKITGNSCGQFYTGGGVQISDYSGTFKLSGGAWIRENWKGGSWDADKDVYVKGDGKASNVYLEDKEITITGELTKTASIGVSKSASGTFTSGLAKGGEDAIGRFVGDDTDYGVTEDESGEAKLEQRFPWKRLLEKLNKIETSGTITLVEDCAQGADDEPFTVPAGKEVTLDLAGHTLTGSGRSVIIVEGTLNLTDSSDDENTPEYDGSGRITGGASYNGGGVSVVGGTFTMNGGKITGNTAYNGGGVNVREGGVFEMKNGVISGNTASNEGGGVYVFNGTFTMKNGAVRGNLANGNSGGGVYVSGNSKLTMTGGEVTGNSVGKSADSGGAVGAGVWFGDGSFELSGGAWIRENWKGGSWDADKDVYVKGDGKASNVYLEDKVITITGELTKTASIGVSQSASAAFTSGLSENGGRDAINCFESDVAGYVVVPDENGEAKLGRALTAEMVSDADAQTYTGEALTPDVTVTDGETTLTENTDYTVSYENNISAGTATLTVTGMGGYTGKVEKQFTIQPAEVTITALDASKAFGEKDVDPVVKIVGVPVKGTGVNYTVSRAEGEDPGKYAITVTANEKDNPNYSITTVGATFTITGVTGDWSASKLMAHVCAPTGSRLVAAAYNDGRLEVVTTVEIGENESLYDTGLAEEEGRTYKLMVVNGSNFTPLYEAWDSTYETVENEAEPK